MCAAAISSSSSGGPNDEWRDDERVLAFARACIPIHAPIVSSIHRPSIQAVTFHTPPLFTNPHTAGNGPIFADSFSASGGNSVVPEGREWVDKGLFLRQELGFSSSAALASDAGTRVFHLYLPVCRAMACDACHTNGCFASPRFGSVRLLTQTAPHSRTRVSDQVYFWLRWLLLRRGTGPRSGGNKCQVIGINAPQGAGKTTLVNSFRDLFRRDGLSSVVLSIDDFYLTRAEQQVTT